MRQSGGLSWPQARIAVVECVVLAVACLITGITTAVILVVAAVSPQHAWEQPILRLADTVVGAIAAWTVTRIKRLWPAPPVPAART